MRHLASGRLREWAIPLVAGAWVVVYFGVRAVLEAAGLPAWLRVAVALLPLLPAALLLRLIVKEIPTMDELHQRVHLEALAMAFPMAIGGLMALGLLGQALNLAPNRHLWHYLPMCYFLALAVAWRRYL